MTEKTENKNEAVQADLEEASDESWWHCLNPSCGCAYQQSACKEAGVCPHCEDTEYSSEPWESTLLNNPHFPSLPVSGETYTLG